MRKRLVWVVALIAIALTVGCMTTEVEGQTLEARPQPTLQTKQLASYQAKVPDTPKAYLYYKAGTSATILERIVTCESGWNPLAENASSTASGLGQFLTSTWISTRTKMGLDVNPELKLDWKQNIDTMVYLFNKAGTSPWNESMPCWRKKS